MRSSHVRYQVKSGPQLFHDQPLPFKFKNVYDPLSRGRHLETEWTGISRDRNEGMSSTQASGAVQPGLAKKPYSAVLGIVAIASSVISATSAALLAFDYLGYHAPGQAPHPTVWILLLALGLCIAVVGQLFGAGRNEGIRARGWRGVITVLHIRLAYAAIVFLGCVLKYAMAGKTIPLYPVGILAIVSGVILASRALTKYVFDLDRRSRIRT